MAAYMEDSNFHRESVKKKTKKLRVTAPQFGIVNIEGLREDYPHVSRDESPPPWWNANIENMYRCQMAGYRDEKHYLMKRRLKSVEKWPENGLIKKLIRWDGLYYYFSNHRECPNLQNEDIKKAFLREPIIFENTAFRDKDLVWAPIITEQAQRFNEACDEMLRTFRKPKKPRKVRCEAGPSKPPREKEEKSPTRIKDKYLLPEDTDLFEKKKPKEKPVEKLKKPKEHRKKSVKTKIPNSRYETGDGIPSKKQSANNGKENMTQNVEATERLKTSEKRDLSNTKLTASKRELFKTCVKSLSASDFTRSDTQLRELPLVKKKSSIKPSTSAVLKSKKDLKSSPIPVSARVAAKKSLTNAPRKVPS